jgi:hypothetical protein
MTAPNTNPLSYNQYIQTMGGLAVYQTEEVSGVWQFTDAPPQLQVPQMLNYAELRIQRDLNLLSNLGSNTYTLTPGQQVFNLDVDDFFTVQTCEICQLSGSTVAQSTPMTEVSREYIQNVYGGFGKPGMPRVWALYGDNWNTDGQDTYTNILLGPAPAYGFTLRITGLTKQPSLYSFATTGVADTENTYISTYLPDLMIMASMVYISMFQRNFSATSDQPEMGLSYEKQYQLLRVGAIADENERRGQASGWSPYPTSTSATPTR